MSIRTFARRTLCALAAACALGATGVHAAGLRICADPDNLPFSKSEGPDKGLYVELARLVGQKIGESPEFVWWLTYNQRKALRNTILQDNCDAYFALPANADYRVRGLVRTKPFLDVSYAIVAPRGLQVLGLADLQGKRIAVLHGSPPHILLAARDGYASTSSFREQEEALAALARGEVDAAILWGPNAGYENLRRHGSRWQVTPVSGEGLGGQVAVGVRKGQEELAARIGQALSELQPQIEELARKYGFPRGQALPLALRAAPDARAAKLAAGLQVNSKWVARTNAPAASSPAQDVIPGRTLFNNVCSHCHGTDGASPVSERDLRKLQRRYKDNWKDTALTTIKNGRTDAGMPSWQATYSEAQIQEVIGFLATLQK